MTEAYVLVEREERRSRRCSLNRPERLNALSTELMAELVAALRELDADPAIRCIVVGGSERAFAAGADIGEMATASAIDMYVARRVDALGRDPRDPHAARRGRVRLLPRRRLRAGDGVRPDRRLRDGGVRPAGDGARASSRAPAARSGSRARSARRWRWTSSSPAAASRRARRSPRASSRASSPREAWLDGGEARGARHRRQGPDRQPAGQGRRRPRATKGRSRSALDYERRLLYLAFASEDAREGLTAFVEKRPPAFEGR